MILGDSHAVLNGSLDDVCPPFSSIDSAVDAIGSAQFDGLCPRDGLGYASWRPRACRRAVHANGTGCCILTRGLWVFGSPVILSKSPWRVRGSEKKNGRKFHVGPTGTDFQIGALCSKSEALQARRRPQRCSLSFPTTATVVVVVVAVEEVLSAVGRSRNRTHLESSNQVPTIT